MPVYTVHLATRGKDAVGSGEIRPSGDAALEGVEFVPERFSRAAFFLGPIWLAWHRLWLEFFLWLVVFSLLAMDPFLGMGTNFLIGVLLEILLGCEANNLRRGRLARNGYRFIDVVSGATREAAERGFFRRYLDSGGALRPSKQSPGSLPDPQAEVLGVFPLAEGPR